MNKLIFGTAKEANEFVGFAKSKGYYVSKPIKEKCAKNAKKAYDIDGKPAKFQWKVLMGVRGKGKRGGKEEEWQETMHITEPYEPEKHKVSAAKEKTNGENGNDVMGKSGRWYYEGMNYGEQN